MLFCRGTCRYPFDWEIGAGVNEPKFFSRLRCEISGWPSIAPPGMPTETTVVRHSARSRLRELIHTLSRHPKGMPCDSLLLGAWQASWIDNVCKSSCTLAPCTNRHKIHHYPRSIHTSLGQWHKTKRPSPPWRLHQRDSLRTTLVLKFSSMHCSPQRHGSSVTVTRRSQ